MNRLPQKEPSGVSALNFLVASSPQPIAAGVSGLLLRRFRYPLVLPLAAVLFAIAGVLVRLPLENRAPSQ
jgi:hypothetical protein